MGFHTFQDEQKIIENADKLLESDEGIDFKAEYYELLKAYKALTKTSRRLVKMSDRSEAALLKANDELTLATEAAERARRETKEFIAMISHELKTPIAVLKSEVELLSEGIRQPNKKNLASLSEEVMQFNHLIRDMFELSLTDSNMLSYVFVECDLLELLEKTVKQIEPRFNDKDITLQFRTCDTSAPLFADPQRIKQVLNNIAKNSWQYTEQGGQVRIALEMDETHFHIHFMDSEPGLTDEALNKIFHRFYRGEGSRSRSTGGAGLGMAICQGIMDAHHGQIVASHSILGGLHIRLSFPKLSHDMKLSHDVRKEKQ